MVDQNLTQLTATTELADGDLTYAVRDPAGTPLDRKVTVANLKTAVAPTYFGTGEGRITDGFASLSSWGVPGAVVHERGITEFAANMIYYVPIWAPVDIEIITMKARVTTGHAGNMRWGFYAADEWWNPTGSPLYQVELAASAGSKAVGDYDRGTTLSIDIPQGPHLAAFITDATISLMTLRGPVAGNSISQDDNISTVRKLSRERTYGLLTADPELWEPESSSSGSSDGFDLPFYMRWRLPA